MKVVKWRKETRKLLLYIDNYFRLFPELFCYISLDVLIVINYHHRSLNNIIIINIIIIIIIINTIITVDHA